MLPLPLRCVVARGNVRKDFFVFCAPCSIHSGRSAGVWVITMSMSSGRGSGGTQIIEKLGWLRVDLDHLLPESLSPMPVSIKDVFVPVRTSNGVRSGVLRGCLTHRQQLFWTTSVFGTTPKKAPPSRR